MLKAPLLPLTLAIASVLSACSDSTDRQAQETRETSTTQAVTQAAYSETERRLQTFFADTYAEDLQRLPFTASYLGVKDNHDKWDPESPAFEAETVALLKSRLATLQTFDRNELSEQAQLSLRLFERSVERRLARDDFRLHHYAIHQFWGAHTDVPSSLINIHRVEDLADAEAYVGRLQNVSTYFDEVIEQLNLRTEQGFMLVDWMYPQILQAAQNVISGAPFDDSTGEDSAIWADIQEKVASLDVEDAQKQRLVAEAKAALQEDVLPAYQRLMTAIEKQSEQAHTDDGVWRFKDGDAYYQSLLEWYTTTDLTAEEVHQLGLSNVERIQKEMRDVMAAVDFEGSLQDFFAYVRANPDLRYPNTDEGREQYLTAAREAIDAMRAQLPAYFGILPQAELTVKRVEPFREQSAGKAFYQSPPPDGSRPGIYYANLYDMDSMPTTDLEALAFHEGLPGHHLQLAISSELEGVPEFQRILNFTAYTEGWGLYSEYLAKEMGFYQDPYSEFGRLAMELWRAARLVVDTGLHYKRWTREEAIAYLVDNTPNAESDCMKAIERYVAMPGQATAYMIGKIQILALRQKAEQALGDKFDIRLFHDVVLGSGAMPLDILEERVNQMIQTQLAEV